MTKNPAFLIPADVADELFQIRNIVSLAAFACEARRVLSEIDSAAQIRPELGSVLGEMVYARSNWQELGDCTGDVLNDVRARLDTLLGETP